MKIPDLDALVRGRTKFREFPPILLALDPGDTTGAAIFRDGVFDTAGHIAGGIPKVPRFIRRLQPSWIVCEDFLLYAHKARDQAWNEMRTPRIIGAIELVCWDLRIPLTFQTAQDGKSFPTDTKLRAWGLYDKGGRHARDAIRHGITFLLFGDPTKAHIKFPTGQGARTEGIQDSSEDGTEAEAEAPTSVT
jgi:hypothetical protein